MNTKFTPKLAVFLSLPLLCSLNQNALAEDSGPVIPTDIQLEQHRLTQLEKDSKNLLYANEYPQKEGEAQQKGKGDGQKQHKKQLRKGQGQNHQAW